MRLFQRRKENFICGHCGAEVIGNGYTNHCPDCLWSRHVDVNPGDRQAQCRGMMEPISAAKRGSETVITHRCLSCGLTKNIKATNSDNFDIIVKLSATP